MRTIVAIFLIFLSWSCNKPKPEPEQETPVTKKVTFHVFGREDYSDPHYDNLNAELRLQVRKIDYHTGETLLLWDSIFSNRKIVDFPQYINKLIFEKTYPVFESKDKLNASYSIKYTFNGFPSQSAEAADLVPGEMKIVLEAGL